MPKTKPQYRLFLGGADLEMVAIKALATKALGQNRIVDKKLKWGANTRAYIKDIRSALARGERPVLVELAGDLPEDIALRRVVIVDHHGERAGADAPSALRQVFDLLGLPRRAWTREYQLIEANDIGHIHGLRGAGASRGEIVKIRNRDRAAQGVGRDVEAQSRRAIKTAKRRGCLTIVHTSAPTASAITDFLAPEFGGPGADNLLVLTPRAVSFFGGGDVVEALKTWRWSWHGGALPDRGYWGANLKKGPRRQQLIARIVRLVNGKKTTHPLPQSNRARKSSSRGTRKKKRQSRPGK